MADLTTIANVEQFLGLPAGNADEALLGRLISAVSQAVERFCSRAFVAQDYTETRDGTGGTRMSFGNTPVISVASVTIDGQPVSPSSGAPQPGYLYSDSALTLIGQRFRRGQSNVALTYLAGFQTVPFDLEQAVIDWVVHVYREKDRIGFISQATAGETTSYLIRDMPPRVGKLLESFKRRVPV